MISLDNALLTSLYAGKSGGTSTTATSAAAQKKKAPTAPWAPAAKAPPASQVVKSVMNGKPFVDENAAKLDVRDASDDYRKIFTVYKGLSAMAALADRADVKDVAAGEVTRLQKRFADGLTEVTEYVDGLKLQKLSLAVGQVAANAKSSVGVKRDSSTYVGQPVQVGGTKTDAAPAFEGDVSFTMTIARKGKDDLNIAIDLADMGETVRTVSAVVAFINKRLSSAGVATRLAVETLPSEARKIVGKDGKPVDVGKPLDRWALKVVGDRTESLSFSADARADAVWLAQRAGTGDKAVRQLVKFQSDVPDTADPPADGLDRTLDAYGVSGRIQKGVLDKALKTVHATAAGADGSVYVLGDVGGTVSNQAIKGDTDVALMKYDSVGKLIWTRTLGSAGEASGFALAVADDGKIAIAGSVKGGLGADTPVAGADGVDSFVTLFDADGSEQWTERRGSRAEDVAKAVTFGADGTVYVAGNAKGAMPKGGSTVGGLDGWLQAFTPTAGTLLKPPHGELKFTTQFGTSKDDSADVLAADGTAVLVGGVEDGRVVLRRFETGSGEPTLTATRDLGPIKGTLTGLSVSNGRLILTGSSTNPELTAGTVTRAHAGGSDAFIAALDPGLVENAGDRLTWFGGAGADIATGAAVVDGEVWISGRAGTDLPDLPKVSDKDGFLVRIDPETGAVNWGRRFTAESREAAPEAIAVAKGGASVLDRLGLPQGTIDPSDSKLLVDATSLRPGDSFEIRVGTGRDAKVEIKASDTLDTLALRIETAVGGRVRAKVVKQGDYSRLQITPRDGRSEVYLSAPDQTRDALEALGLQDSLLRTADAKGRAYGLSLSPEMRIDTKEGRKATLDTLRAAMGRLRNAYTDMVTPPADPKAKKPGAASGPPPAYLTKQIASYQQALARLSG